MDRSRESIRIEICRMRVECRQDLEARERIGGAMRSTTDMSAHSDSLAANTAIAAARAARTGAGFALVTGEVTRLLPQTGKSRRTMGR
jgi:hypothetical protein